MTFKFKVKYKWVGKNVVFSIKTARISETVSGISEIIYDTTRETEIANKKSHDSFQVIRLSMTLAIFQGH